MGLFDNPDDHRRAVDEVSLKAWERSSEGRALRFDPTEQNVDLDEVKEELTRSDKIAVARFIQRFMDFIWQDGPRIERATKRLYIITREFSPDHLLRMNNTEIGILCNDTRQTMSARRKVVKRGLEKLLSDPSYAPKAKFSGAKTAVAKYKQAQRGNNNRTGGIAERRKYASV